MNRPTSCSCCHRPTYCAARRQHSRDECHRRVIDIGQRNAEMDVGPTSELCNSALLFRTHETEPTSHQCLILNPPQPGASTSRTYHCDFLVSNAFGKGLVYICLPSPPAENQIHYSVVQPVPNQILPPPCLNCHTIIAVLEPGEWRNFSVRSGQTIYQLASGKSTPGLFV